MRLLLRMIASTAFAALIAGAVAAVSGLVIGFNVEDTPPPPSAQAMYWLGYQAGESHAGHVPTDCGMPNAAPFQEGYCDGFTDSEHPT